jgi:DNA-directed RNA polymerase specialized sigma24 family protein
MLLAQIEASAANRNEAIVLAHGTGAYSYQQIAEYFDIHFTTVGRVVRAVG